MFVKTNNDIQQFLPVTDAFNLEDIKPFLLNNAEPDFLIPALSQTQFDALQTRFDNNQVQLTDKEKKLISLINQASLNYALELFLDWAQVNISQDGIHIIVNDTRKTAFQWQIQQVQKQCNQAAYRGLERMLIYLETEKTVFTGWAASSSYTIFKQCFINTAEEFSKFVNISGSRRTFLSIKPIMQRVEERKVKDTLVSTLYDEIKTQINTDTVSANNKELLKFIQPAVANLTMADAVNELSLEITDMGIVVSSTSEIISNNVKTPVDADRLSSLENKFRKNGEAELQLLDQYLQKNASATVYPLFFSSSRYVGPPTEPGTSASGQGGFVGV